MAKAIEPTVYMVLEKSFINNRIIEAGETVIYDGKPGTQLEHVSGPVYSEDTDASDLA